MTVLTNTRLSTMNWCPVKTFMVKILSLKTFLPMLMKTRHNTPRLAGYAIILPMRWKSRMTRGYRPLELPWLKMSPHASLIY